MFVGLAEGQKYGVVARRYVRRCLQSSGQGLPKGLRGLDVLTPHGQFIGTRTLPAALSICPMTTLPSLDSSTIPTDD